MKIRRSASPICLATSLLLLGPGLRPAMAQLLGLEFQVNSYTTLRQHTPEVAADGSGNFVVVWRSEGQDGSDYGIFGQRFNSAGSKAGSEFQVNTYTTGFQGYNGVAVAADASGNFVVAWQGDVQDGSGWGVFGQRFNSAGSKVGSEFQVNSFTTFAQIGAAVAMDGSGNFVVAWESNGSSTGDSAGVSIQAQRYAANGAAQGVQFLVNSYTTSHQWHPKVAAGGSGDFVVAWESSGQDGSLAGVFGQRFDSVGSPAGTEFRVNTYTMGNQLSPAVAADGAGNFIVVWYGYGQDGAGTAVLGQRFSSAGSTVGSEFQVNSFTTNYQVRPAVAADGSGNFVVVWKSSTQDGSSSGVFGQRFNSAGSKVGSEFQVNSYTTAEQGNSKVAADGSGNFVVVWTSNGQDGSGVGVFGQRLSNWILIDGFELGDACDWSAAVGGGCP